MLFALVLFVAAPGDIYTSQSDGTGLKALTRDGQNRNAVWSPDGKQILFINRLAELHVMNADGTNRRLLRRMESAIYSAAWSPDGKTLAVAAAQKDRPGVFLLSADGKGEPRFLSSNAFTPAWSPDGKKIAYSLERPRGTWTIHVANADGLEDVRLLSGGSPAWSPKGDVIAYGEYVGGREQIFAMSAGGSQMRQVTNDANWACAHPSWSPDGKTLAFYCRSADKPCGTVSSVGGMLPECTLRVFTKDMTDAESVPSPLNDRDGTTPAFAPALRYPLQ